MFKTPYPEVDRLLDEQCAAMHASPVHKSPAWDNRLEIACFDSLGVLVRIRRTKTPKLSFCVCRRKAGQLF
jgi:hypothetical protein